MSASARVRRLVPEVVQTSAMDCGPATLSALLNGCGVPVSYPRLRELCQTDVDGTSIDTMEDLACELGLDAEQVVLPKDCVLSGVDDVLPCIVVTALPSGLTHFVIAWRTDLGRVQVMDPGSGRRWMSRHDFLESLYEHHMAVDSADWLEYAATGEFRASLAQRLGQHVGLARAEALIEQAYEGGSWQRVADLDALARLGAAIGNRRDGRAALAELCASVEQDPDALRGLIPEPYYQVTPTNDEDEIELHGVVLIKVNGVNRDAHADQQDTAETPLEHVRGATRVSIVQELRQILANAGMRNTVPALAGAGIAIGLLTLLEGLLFRYLLDLELVQDPLLLTLLAAVLLAPLLGGVLLDRGAFGLAFTVGRQIDSRLRIRLLERLPRMRDSFFASRLVSDLAERGHAVAQLKDVPEFLVRATAAISRLIWISIGLAVLAPDVLWLVALMLAVALGLPALLYRLIVEKDLQARAHLAALGRVNLDALRGAEPIWSHAGAGALELEHEHLLGNWRRTGLAMLKASVAGEALVTGVLLVISATLVLLHLPPSPMTLGSTLLLAFWALTMPLVAGEIFQLLRQAPTVRNISGRVVELFAPDELEDVDREAPFTQPVRLRFVDAGVHRAQIPVLDDLNLDIRAGERVAVIGASGAGKSSLVTTLLGFQPVTTGTLLIDDRPATPSALAMLREATVCIDSELYLWNRSVLDNLLYGNREAGETLDAALTESGVKADLASLQSGLATQVGENGARLSGGEGQRVRIARGMLHEDPALLLLDEPFRGMDSTQRDKLLDAVLQRWPAATTLFVTHDVGHTIAFDRVLVVAQGRVIENGSPDELRADPASTYAQLLAAEQATRERLDDGWGHVRLAERRLEIERGG